MMAAVAEILKKDDNFIVAGHVQPDGDGIGSALALTRSLRRAGKQARLLNGEKGRLPAAYRFLPGLELYQELDFDPAGGIFIAVDCANLERLGGLRSAAQAARLMINIDHHPDNTGFADYNLVNPTASSCAELVFLIIEAAGLPLDYETALCLYVGIVTDTGRFQYGNTSAESLKIAARLVEMGVKPNYVFQNIYERSSIPRLKIVGLGLSKAVYNPELKFIYTIITKDEMNAVGASLSDTDSLVDRLRAVDGAMVAAVIKETFEDHKIKVSLRSKNGVDVGGVAAAFNGGGHRNAAGYISTRDIGTTLNSLIKSIAELKTEDAPRNLAH